MVSGEAVVLLAAAVVTDLFFGLVGELGAHGFLWKEERRSVERLLFGSMCVR